MVVRHDSTLPRLHLTRGLTGTDVQTRNILQIHAGGVRSGSGIAGRGEQKPMPVRRDGWVTVEGIIVGESDLFIAVQISEKDFIIVRRQDDRWR